MLDGAAIGALNLYSAKPTGFDALDDVLVAQQRIDPDEAFDRLRNESQSRNVKLRDIAQQIVASTRPG